MLPEEKLERVEELLDEEDGFTLTETQELLEGLRDSVASRLAAVEDDIKRRG